MNKIEQLWNRVELAAHKMGVAAEDVLLMIEGKHPTHVLMQTKEISELNPPKPVTGAATTSSPATPSAPSAVASASGAASGSSESTVGANPTISGPAAASVAGQQSNAASTAGSSTKED